MRSDAAMRKHERYMRQCIALAMRGTGSVSPNPRVGCVIVDDASGRVIASGYHRKFGGPHAEADALSKGRDVRGAVAYVSLEPCSHTGKTPPCADALVAAGVSTVVAGTVDPDPRVSGRGVQRLRDAGITVITGVLEAECRWLNRGFIRRVTLGRPWVTIKAAVSVDGAMALASGESKWITGPAARARAHLLRADNDAVLVGAGTAMQDDPQLSVRDCDGASPMRVLIDPSLRVPHDRAIYRGGRTVVFASRDADARRADEIAAAGATIVRSDDGGRMDVQWVLGTLAEMGVNRLLVEGGARTIASFVGAGLVDECSFFVAPKLMGRGISLADGVKFEAMSEIMTMRMTSSRRVGDDVWIEGVPACSPDL